MSFAAPSSGLQGVLTAHCGGFVRCSRSYALNGRMSSILYPSRSSISLASSTVFTGAPARTTNRARRRLDAIREDSRSARGADRRGASAAEDATHDARDIVARGGVGDEEKSQVGGAGVRVVWLARIADNAKGVQVISNQEP